MFVKAITDFRALSTKLVDQCQVELAMQCVDYLCVANEA